MLPEDRLDLNDAVAKNRHRSLIIKGVRFHLTAEIFGTYEDPVAGCLGYHDNTGFSEHLCTANLSSPIVVDNMVSFDPEQGFQALLMSSIYQDTIDSPANLEEKIGKVCDRICAMMNQLADDQDQKIQVSVPVRATRVYDVMVPMEMSTREYAKILLSTQDDQERSEELTRHLLDQNTLDVQVDAMLAGGEVSYEEYDKDLSTDKILIGHAHLGGADEHDEGILVKTRSLALNALKLKMLAKSKG
jgi:hypothetical protein